MVTQYLEKRSATGFHNHMWRTLQRKLDGSAKAVSVGPRAASPTHTEVDSKQKNTELSSATISEVFDQQSAKTSSTELLQGPKCADITRARWANPRQLRVLLPILYPAVHK